MYATGTVFSNSTVRMRISLGSGQFISGKDLQVHRPPESAWIWWQKQMPFSVVNRNQVTEPTASDFTKRVIPAHCSAEPMVISMTLHQLHRLCMVAMGVQR
jgi:hypothetical protein